MAILIINRFSSNKLNYAELLKPTNQQLLLITGQHGFDRNLYDHIEVIDHLDETSINKITTQLITRYKIQYVIALSELDLIVASKIREKLNIVGQGIESAIAFRDKIVMKDLAKKIVDVPDYKRIESKDDIVTFIKKNGYPIVIKPVDGAGSSNTHIIYNEDQLEELISSTDLKGYEIERFIDGVMYKVDGLIHKDSIILSWPSKYINDCLSFKDGKQATYIQLHSSHPLYNRLNTYCEQLLKYLPTPNSTTFHAEIIHTPDNRLVLCEIASRTGGGGVAEVSELIYGLNITEEWIKGQVDLPIKKPIVNDEKLYGVVLIPPKEKLLVSLPERPKIEWVVNYIPEGKIGQVYTKARNSVYYIIMVIITGENETELIHRMNYITETLEASCVWE
ncbi:ATP-grasp domain-containing protein [Bacillus sp. E(2018)]|uniref:ATP-grasp domain-containing protein n=1 Tax=Bacillus sp. E(2018) TaxID=2502239 RepID=UPI0010F8E2BE|nr:ATP-grasp domain-containing protein [Bacillus sp. E(2018)]